MPYSATTARPAEASGTFPLGGKAVNRLGYGAMQITGEGIWGEPRDRDERSGWCAGRWSSG